MEYICHFSLKDPVTTVLTALHPPKTIPIGGGWPLMKDMHNFFKKLCRTCEVNMVLINVLDLLPH